MAEIVLKNLTKRYRSGFTLRECSLTIGDGSFTVIVGPSGCGKTTLLRLIAGLEKPDAGEIRIAGKVANALRPPKRDVAMVFQDFALYPHMRLRQNLAFAARQAGVSKNQIDRRIAEIAKALNIAHLLDRKPGNLSGGERQRAALGRVLVRQPACALYDEPLSNLDAGLREQLRSELKVLHQQFGGTSVLVTHDQHEAMSLADQLVVMADGSIQQVGYPLEIYHQPANRFVAGFIGSPAMNFIEGQIKHETGSAFFEHPDLRVALGDDHAKLSEQRATLGFRPEAMLLDTEGPSLHTKVIMVEPLGALCNVHCQTAHGAVVIAQMKAMPRVGEQIAFRIDSQQVHLFELGDFGNSL